jgi:hypothetical protein
MASQEFHVQWRRVVETHLQKADRKNAFELLDVIERAIRSCDSRFGHNFPFKKLIDVNSTNGALTFAAVVVRDLVAIVEISPSLRRILILAVLDFQRVKNRQIGTQCYIVDRYFDIDDSELDLTIALDPNKRIVCSHVTDWTTGKVEVAWFDPLNDPLSSVA